MSPDAALVACRFLHDGAAMLLWGAFATLSMLVPQDLAGEIGRRLQLFRFAAITVAVATTVAALPLEAASIGDGWGDAVNPTMVRDVLFESSVGQAWPAQAVAALLVLSTLALRSPAYRIATALTSGLLLATLALTGHTAMQEGWLGTAHHLNDAVHVLAAGAWLGALAALLPILRALDHPGQHADAGLALKRFSRAGYVAVALVVASGVINTMLTLGTWPTDWSSPYQAMLAAKIALVGLMIGIATVNRFVFVPHVARHSARAATAIRFGTVTEIVLGLAVIDLVSRFGMLAPA